MSFHNGWLLGGIAAFAIPLIIHILNKRRFKEVHWGAMHLLVDVVKKNNKRIRIEQLLLLLLRIAIPIILALCLARPFLTKMRALFGNQKTSTVYLLDDSFSMQAGGSSASNFQKGTRAIENMIKALPKGSDASVILMGGGARTLLDDPTTALEVIGEKFEDVNGEGDPAAVSESIHEGAAELARMSNSAQEVVIVTDFQKGDWDESKAAAREGSLDQLWELEIPPLVTLFRVGENLGENLAIESVEFSSLVLGVGQKATIRVNLRNFGKTSYPDTMVHLDVDGERLRSSQVTLPPEGDAQVLFTHAFEEAGSHTITVTTSGDALEADNKFFASVPVWDEVKTLLVEGSPSDEPLGGATDFLDIALQPFGAAKTSLNDLIKTEVIRTNELNRDRLKEAQVVILANVPELNGGQVNDLKEFVKQGGGLIVFAGDKVKPDFYGRSLFDDGKGLLPLPYSGLGGDLAAGRILNQRHAHPALAFFNDPRNGKLGDAEFTTWLKPEIPEGTRAEVAAGARRDVSTLLRLDDGTPYLVEKKYGSGRVIQSASGADTGWANLPTKPVFVPLVQRLVTYLAASVAPPVNLKSGDPLTAFLAKEEAGEKAKLISPDGTEHELAVKREGERGVAEFKGTRLPGIYTITDSKYVVQNFAVNLSRDESEIAPLVPEELTKVAEGMNGRVVNSLEEYYALDDERRFGQEIWKPLLWVLLAFLFLEIFYQQWLTKREL